MTSKSMNNNYNNFSQKVNVFDVTEITSFLNTSSYSNELDLTSTPLFPISNSTSFSNAFTQQQQQLQIEDNLLLSPLGLTTTSSSSSSSPFDDFNSNSFDSLDIYNSPMLTNYSSNSSIIQGLTTPELNSDLELPNLFYPELGSSTAISSGSNSNWDPLDLNLANLQALLDSSIPSNGNLYTSSGSTSASTGAISPQLTRLDSPKLENLILPNFNLITTSQVLPTPSLPLPIVKKGGRKRKEILIESESEDLESTIVESLEIEAIKPLVFARDKFNGSRNTKIKPIDFNAPTMSRSYVIPSITSRKRAPPAISAKLLPTLINKRVKRDLTPSSATAFDEFNDEGVDPSELPDELLSAIELKRRQNTLAARRSRMRKAAHLDDVKKAEDEARKQVEATKKELNEWKRRALVAEAELKLLKGF